MSNTTVTIPRNRGVNPLYGKVPELNKGGKVNTPTFIPGITKKKRLFELRLFEFYEIKVVVKTNRKYNFF